MPRTHRFSVLDSLRGLAALAIVIFHTPLLLGAGGAELFRHSEPFVQFFFVLGGFVLFHAYGQRLSTATLFGRFVAARSFRILPLHLCLLGLFLLLDVALPHMVGAAPNLLANLLLLPAWLPGANGLSLNPAAASLGIGFYLSLLFGLALLILPRGRGGACLLLVAAALWGLLSGVDGLGRSVLMGVGGFCLGALSYSLHLSLGLLPLGQRAFTLLEVTVLALLALILDSAYAYRDLYAVALFALALFIFAFEGGLVSRLLHRGLFRHLGRWAFAIYLGHLAVFMALGNLVPLLFRDGRPALLDTLLAPVAVLAVIALAALLHRYVERPGMALGRRLLTPRAGTAQAGKVSQASG
jgi:peptidoglycan/LPS O-acetylase OafA/YrhL